MNVLKSIFISSFVIWLILVGIYAPLQLARGAQPTLSWLGLTLAAAGPLAFFVRVFLHRTARTARHPVGYSVVGGAGLAIAMAASYRYGPAAGWTHLWAGLTLIGWLAYLRWYSVLRRHPMSRLQPGSDLPEFQVQDLDGRGVTSASFKTTPHLLVFYRGNWCPFCCAQVEELAAYYRQLSERGVRIVLISPQPAGKATGLAERFEVPMHFLTDPGNRAARKLGIEHAWGTPMGMQLLGYGSHTVMPTVIVCDAQGKIVYLDQTDNYRVRPDPAVFEELFDRTADATTATL